MAPDQKQLTIAYAAGASLAAITLVYVFGPTFFIDGTGANASSSDRKRTVVGLYNPANDCFVNSVLQALAGLGELRAYLVTRCRLQVELETRSGSHYREYKGRRPILTVALKHVLDKLNERPIYKKTISSRDFLTELERVFRQRISRSQQDAQEFLQIVAQTIAEEHASQERFRAFVMKLESEGVLPDKPTSDAASINTVATTFESEKEAEVLDTAKGDTVGATTDVKVDTKSQPTQATETKKEDPTELNGMPMEGKLESSIECQTCLFKPKPSVSTFVALTLNVPQTSSTTLNKCLNDLLSTEYIDDFQCEKCRLTTAIDTLKQRLKPSNPDCTTLGDTISRLEQCLIEDPEKIPDDITLPPPPRGAKRSKIARRTYMSACPNVLAIHLSRSIYDFSSRKNGCKISFPEYLTLGSILDRREYKLLAVVTHKGGHDSGHYECFRRQIVHPPPYHTSAASGNSSAASSSDSSRNSLLQESLPVASSPSPSPSASTNSGISTSPSATSTMASVRPTTSTAPSSTVTDTDSSTTPKTPSSNPLERKRSLRTTAELARTSLPQPSQRPEKLLRKQKPNNRWWRISDEKIKETRTSDVLSLQKEVYLLYYERDWSR